VSVLCPRLVALFDNSRSEFGAFSVRPSLRLFRREAGLASGLITTSQQIGGGIGLAIVTSVATTRTNNLLSSGVAAPAASTDGFALAFSVGVGFAVTGLIATVVLLRRRRTGVSAQPTDSRLEADDEQVAA
jgi:hypothetical protein